MSNPEMIKIVVTEDVLKMNGQVYGKGDQVSFTPSDAKIICDHGWGKAVNKEFATKDREPGAKLIKPDDVIQVA